MTVGEIEAEHPVPARQPLGKLRKQMLALKVGESFLTSASKHNCYVTAARIRIGVRVREEGDGFRVWRSV